MDPKQIVHSDPEIVTRDASLRRHARTRARLARLPRWGETIEELLDDFPSVSREQAVAFLDEAGRALLARTA